MKQATFSRKALLAVIVASIGVFIVFFYLYNPFWNNISGFIRGIDIYTQFSSSKFKRNLIFAIIPGVTPIIGLFISKYIRIKHFVAITVILILFEFFTAIARLLIVKDNIVNQISNKISISIEKLRFEEFLFVGLVLGCLILIIFLRRNDEKH